MKKDESKKTLSRRSFLKTGSAAAGAGFVAAGVLGMPQKGQAAPVPQKWDEEIDVVVIGSGFAGLAAAYEAKKAGSSVAVLEKMRVPGGNSIINGGVVAAAGSPKQKAEGIKDSPELMYKDMLKAGLYLNHTKLAKLLADNSTATTLWTIDELGVKYHEKVVHLGGHSEPRSYSTWNRSGSAIVNQQLAKLKEIGVKVRTGTFLTGLVTDEAGGVIGVTAKKGYKFPDAESGAPIAIKAKKAVVLASGGFGRDLEFRMIQDPKLDDTVDSTNHPGATAEGLLYAFGIGATPVQTSWIQLGPWTSPDEKGFGVATQYTAGIIFIYSLMVDAKTGKRFVNELADRKIRADAILKTGQPAIGIADENMIKFSGRESMLETNLKAGTVKKFDTLEDLAKGYGMPFAELKAQIERFNSYVKDAKDPEFGKYMREGSPTIGDKGPFYGVRIWPKVHHTMGGIQINEKAQVINLQHKPIPGLYAAGEVTGGIHGAVRLGSVAVVDCLFFGRIAGQNAAAEKAKS